LAVSFHGANAVPAQSFQGPKASPAPDQTGSRLKTLEAKLPNLDLKVAELQFKLSQLEFKVSQLENSEKSAIFDPTRLSIFQRIQTQNGTFLLSIESVEPYLDGVRVSMDIGNPSAANYDGFSLKAKWGGREPEFGLTPEALKAWNSWHQSLRSGEFSFTNTLSTATWNRVSFILSPAPPTQFGYLELSMFTKTVSLRESPRR